MDYNIKYKKLYVHTCSEKIETQKNNILNGKNFSANFQDVEQILSSAPVSTSQAKRKLEIEQVIKALFFYEQ